ncbi:hypothetical protein D3C81_1992860 [compost metagenome]
MGSSLSTIIYSQSTHALSEALGEFSGNPALYVEAVRCSAGFAAVAHFCDHGTFDGNINVGVIEYWERSITTQLHGAVHY